MAIRGIRLGSTVILALLLTGCRLISSQDSGIAASNNESQGPTVEVRGRSSPKMDVVPAAIKARVFQGDVYVNVMPPEDANRVQMLARDVTLTDNEAERVFISDTIRFAEKQGEIESIEIAPGPGTPRLETHLYVQAGVPIDIDADNGNIIVTGNTGDLTALARNGTIEVFGSTRPLTLTTRGANRPIRVDGAHQQLNLRTDNGAIEVVANDVKINAVTGAGDILFTGKLLDGPSYFTTTSGSNITIITFLFDRYEIEASTRGNTIDVQYPAIESGKNLGNPVCATFDAGAPYIMRLDDRDHRTRGQVTLNKGDTRSAGDVALKGIVTPNYFAFDSTARNVLLEAPSVSEFYIETVPRPASTPVGLEATLAATPVITATFSVPPPIVPTQDIPPELMQTFQNATIAPAVELAPGQTQANAVTPAPGGVMMYALRCPVPKEERLPQKPGRVKIYAISGGGHIRIYQNLP